MKVVVLSLFIRYAAFNIFKKMMKKFMDTNLEGALSLSLNNRTLDFERNIEHLDTKFTSDVDLGLTILFEQLTAVLFGVISSALFLVIGLPFLLIIFVSLYLMGRIDRLLFMNRLSHITRLNAFYFKLLYHRVDFMGFKKEEELFKDYKKLLKNEVIHESNKEWLIEALGIMLEIVFLVMLVITIVVSLVRFDLLRGDAFIELSISFLIGMSNTSRIQLKMMSIMSTNIIGISNIFVLLDEKKIHNKPFPDQEIESVKFNNFSTTFQDNRAEDINLKIEAGERLVVLGSKRSGKRIVFLNMIKIL